MNFFQAVFLGIVQGLTEFIPVSSSGHLVLSQYFFGIGESENILFELFMHLGTLVAVLVYFRKTLWDLLVSLFSWGNTMHGESHRKNRNLIVFLATASLATGAFYATFGDYLRQVYDIPLTVAVLLIFTGAIVFVSDYLKDSGIPASNMGIWRTIIIGLAQGLAILPGISRSGTTITASLATGVKRKDAAHFSFLLSIPAILAANISEFKAFTHIEPKLMHVYIAGFISSMIVGYLVIAFLIRLIENSGLKYFAIYCWVIGLISILLMVFK